LASKKKKKTGVEFLPTMQQLCVRVQWDSRVVVYDFEGSGQSIRLIDQGDGPHIGRGLDATQTKLEMLVI
jgi:hypothetical protein